MTDDPQLCHAELAALADGSLPEQRRAQLRARIDASPELAAALAEQERAVTMLRAQTERAPGALRARVDEMTGAPQRTRRRRPALRRRRSLFGLGATALAVAVAVLVILLAGGGSAQPSIPQTAHLALDAATSPAPAQDAAHRNQLRLGVGAIAFPYYGQTAGWEATGARADSLHGRRVVTVFYSAGGARVGYAIVSGAPLPVDGGHEVTRDGVRYTLQRFGAARLITWRQAGHTCVIAGRGVSDGTLLALASVRERQAAA